MKKIYSQLNTIFLIILLIANSCTYNEKEEDEKKELLIYCGITMIRPMTEIKEIIEEQENCSIEITKGGSGNLLKAIETSGVGDIYFPGSENYISTAYSKGLIRDTATVGRNRLVMMVQKGNPLNISSDLNNLSNKDYYIVIGNPNSGSVGKATKKALQQKGVFEQVEQNTIRFTTDSKDLNLALISKEADLVVNWYAPYTWDNNADYIDIIEIDEKYAQNKKLILAVLSCSQHTDIGRKILELAKSDRGKAIFKKHGFN